MRYKATGLTVSTLCAVSSFAPAAHATESSIWAARPGVILPSDQTAWCSLSTSTNSNGLFTVTGNLVEVNTDGTIANSAYTDSSTTISVSVQCFNPSTGVVAAPANSLPPVSKNATIPCPPGDSTGYFLRCQITRKDNAPFVYDGSNHGGSPCANGVSGITVPSGTTNGFVGQVTGYVANLDYGPPTNALFNQSLMTDAQVYGTDMGYMFYAHGQLWSGYGDTWASPGQTSPSNIGRRGSVLFSTTNLNPSSGLTFQSFVGALPNGIPAEPSPPSPYPTGPGYATEIVPSCHNLGQLLCNEQTAIASAGFGLQESGHSYQVLWFTSFGWSWPAVNDSSVAWSEDGGAFVRGDQSAPNAVVWGNGSNFGAGAIWQDRMSGWIYFFGTVPYQNGTGIRLARVPAKMASIKSASAYKYWNGSGWVSTETSAANIIGPTYNQGQQLNPGPELSVAFDAYSDSFLMMLVANRNSAATTGEPPGEAIQIWQSHSPTGPWSLISTGNSLPQAAWVSLGRYPGNYNYFYGPYMSEQFTTGGGQGVYYQLSEWNAGAFQTIPYNTGLWTYNVNTNPVSSCLPQ